MFLVLIAGLSYMNLQSGPNLLEVPDFSELISVNDAGVPLGGMKVLIPLFSTGGRRSQWVRNWAIWRYFRDYFPIRVSKSLTLYPGI